jgi:DNA-binding Xre family transcriptional regulator
MFITSNVKSISSCKRWYEECRQTRTIEVIKIWGCFKIRMKMLFLWNHFFHCAQIDPSFAVIEDSSLCSKTSRLGYIDVWNTCWRTNNAWKLSSTHLINKTGLSINRSSQIGTIKALSIYSKVLASSCISLTCTHVKDCRNCLSFVAVLIIDITCHWLYSFN